MDLYTKIAFAVSVFLLALITGLFYAYSCSVNPGLGRLSDSEYLKGFQSINRAIQNPVFFLSFMGTLIALPVTTWMLKGETETMYLFLAASCIYGVGVFGVTIFGNVPLNETLDGINLSAMSSGELADIRLAFESKWNRFHTIRTVACLSSLIVVILALIRKL